MKNNKCCRPHGSGGSTYRKMRLLVDIFHQHLNMFRVVPLGGADKLLPEYALFIDNKCLRQSGGPIFLTDIAPRAITSSYLKLAKPLAEAGQYDRAIELINSGLEISPDNQQLKKALEKYQGLIGL